jgi:hypothetical protein
MGRSKKVTQRNNSAKPVTPGEPSVLQKIASRTALEALENALATAQANGPFPAGALAGIASHAKSAANDVVEVAERVQRHFAAVDASPRLLRS